MLALALAAGATHQPARMLIVEPGNDLLPREAVTAGVEGDVPVTLEIDAQGNLRCLAHGGAELALLKRPSCEIIAQRDIFAPSVSPDGKLSATTLELVVRWRKNNDIEQFGGAIPISRAFWVRHFDHPPAMVHNMIGGHVKVVFTITAVGRIIDCKVSKTSYNLQLDAPVCPLLESRAVLLPAIGSDGAPHATQGWFNVNWQVGPLNDDFSVDAGP
jgi:hypothetical protein